MENCQCRCHRDNRMKAYEQLCKCNESIYDKHSKSEIRGMAEKLSEDENGRD